MIQVRKKTDCCGCSACGQICPKGCISMEADGEGFWYPKVNEDLCIGCGLCEKACPVLNPKPERTPLHVYAAVNTDDGIRSRSASGGIFSVVAERVIKEGGAVFGVKFDKDWNVVFGHADTIEGLEAFRRSKYVQAWAGDSFKETKKSLEEGRKTLFTGVPCQIAGLKQFLGKEYGNLITVDLICAGVPSPKVWKRYLAEELAEIVKKARRSGRLDGKDIVIEDVSFRDKSGGWKKYGFALSLSGLTADGGKKAVTLPRPDKPSPYMQMLFQYAYMRPICYECPFKSCKSQSDITIADYWGIGELHPEMDDDRGTSMVFVNTGKGEEYFDKSKTRYLETSYEESWPYNNVVTGSKKHPRRDRFYSRLDRSKSVIRLMNRTVNPLPQRIRKLARKSVRSAAMAVLGEKAFRRLSDGAKRIIR